MRTRWTTVPPREEALAAVDGPDGRPPRPGWSSLRPYVVAGLTMVLLVGGIVLLTGGAGGAGDRDAGLGRDGQVTLVVFALAVWAWVFTSLDDTYVALGATVSLVLLGVLSTDEMFQTLGDDTVWLLLAAFVIAAGVTSSGLATRATAYVVSAARSPRQLAHLLTAALVVTTFAVPSTSGRAALALPVFLALAAVFADRPRLVKALALLFPTVILLSAVGSLLGAGAHLVTSEILRTAVGEGISFVDWVLLGLPLAVVSSHLAAELVLRLFTDAEERRRSLVLAPADFEAQAPGPVTGPLSVAESRAALLLAAVVVLWCSEPLHGVDPAVVALVGALVAASPRYGSVSLSKALKAAPWSLLLFLAATLALGSALTSSGAAEWFARRVFSGFTDSGAAAVPFLLVVIVVSTLMHLLVQSRSARSSVLVPIVVALAPTVGVDPVAAAFASTAAAGFCHTLPSSAKPVALFARVEGTVTYRPPDLLRLSLFLAPLSAGLVAAFTFVVWPLLGQPYR
ncbi:SLC13 family permease [Nocardioides litoris]|uniref:SLC13 family permease n=1 Tax=Nocardioides litoris TaxID=1926648 RepID=UPI001B85FAFB|nr:SLC13 family permease [Nocardioides litoris]